MQTELAAKNMALQSESVNMLEAMRRGDMKAFKDSAQRVQDLLDDQLKIARELADKTKNPEQKKALLEQIKKLESLKKQLHSAVDAVLKDPHNEMKQKEVERIMGQIIDEADKLTTEGLKNTDGGTQVPTLDDLPEKGDFSFFHLFFLLALDCILI